MALAEVFANAIEDLTQDDYDEDQRAAWIAVATDGDVFARRLAGMLTLVVQVGADYAGFASLKDNTVLEMVYVSPHYAGEGVATTLVDALERIAAARGAKAITVDSSDTAVEFFQRRGYVATHRNTVPLDDQWLANTTLRKELAPPAKGSDHVH